MTNGPAIRSADDRWWNRPPSIVALWIAGSALLWVLYTLVFLLTPDITLLRATTTALANTLPLSLLAVAIRAILKTEVMKRSVPAQLAWHVVLAIAFSTILYATILILLALFSGLRGSGYEIESFWGAVFVWQTFQGLILYIAIAAVCYAIRGGREAAQVTIMAPGSTPPKLTRYLTRQGDAMTPIDVSDVVSITGAQDYAEVSTLDGIHLVRLSLAEFEARLDPAEFVRVHRSAIIHLRHLARTESAGGGRMLAHMANGATVPVSRAGVQALRRFAV